MIEPELVLEARRAELPGGLAVRRALPRRQRRMVGPFVFVDQMGPVAVEPGREFTVLPHPHIGLSTLTYLFEGEGLHRDSLGSVQRLLPGEVNWMTAGRGVVHSERLRAAASRVFGVQIWVALPRDLEECDPSFDHYGADAVATVQEGDVTLRIIAGSLFGARSAVRVSSPLFYVEALLPPGAELAVPDEYPERAVFVVEGALTVGTTRLHSGVLAFLPAGLAVPCRAQESTRLLLLGGTPLEGPRHILWNFVSSSQERLARAADDWRHLRFPRIPGETAYIPLPQDGHEPVNYP
ncbi:MAG: pirin family protein [Pseudomonadota bacterium]